MLNFTVLACIGWIIVTLATKEHETAQKHYIEEDWSDPKNVKVIVH